MERRKDALEKCCSRRAQPGQPVFGALGTARAIARDCLVKPVTVTELLELLYEGVPA